MGTEQTPETTPSEPKLVEYINLDYNPQTREIKRPNEWILRVHPTEVAILYAAHHIHYLKQQDADKNIGEYHAHEQFNILSEPETISIGSQVDLLRPPLLKGMQHNTGTNDAIKEVNGLIKTIFPYTVSNTIFHGAYTSIDWFTTRSNSRPPDLNPKDSGTSYEVQNLPANFMQVAETESTDFNKDQLRLLSEAKDIVLQVLDGIEDLHNQYKAMSPLEFSHNVFRTWQRIDDALHEPDPDTKHTPEPPSHSPIIHNVLRNNAT